MRRNSTTTAELAQYLDLCPARMSDLGLPENHRITEEEALMIAAPADPALLKAMVSVFMEARRRGLPAQASRADRDLKPGNVPLHYFQFRHRGHLFHAIRDGWGEERLKIDTVGIAELLGLAPGSPEVRRSHAMACPHQGMMFVGFLAAAVIERDANRIAAEGRAQMPLRLVGEKPARPVIVDARTPQMEALFEAASRAVEESAQDRAAPPRPSQTGAALQQLIQAEVAAQLAQIRPSAPRQRQDVPSRFEQLLEVLVDALTAKREQPAESWGTTRELAAMVGISHQTVYRMLSGHPEIWGLRRGLKWPLRAATEMILDLRAGERCGNA